MEYVLIAIVIIAIAHLIFKKKDTKITTNNVGTVTQEITTGSLVGQVTIVRNGVSEKGVLKMGQGLEVYDSSGNNIFNSSTINFKKLGSFSVTGEAGSHVDNNIVGKNIVFFVESIEMITDGIALHNLYPTRITVSGNTISWEYNYYTSTNTPVGWVSNYSEYASKGKQKITFAYGWV